MATYGGSADGTGRVLVIGGGGREHALCWALDRAPSVTSVVCAPGNAGIAEVAEVVPVDPVDPAAVVALARAVAADLVVVGPEAPLVAGVVDALRDAGITAFGPTAAAARLEASKAFAKGVMAAAGVPTARHWSGADPDAARAALDAFTPPYVVKADGLAAGKGVRICADRAEAEDAIADALVRGAFGAAGRSVVLEAFLEGPECSLFGLSDGHVVLPMAPAQDAKRAFDGDRGPNTGGMGAYSPVPAVGPEVVEDVRRRVLQPVVDEMRRRGTPFTGVLYAGLALTADGPVVIEFNARFGDPETQIVLPLLDEDLGALLLACAQGRLGDRGPLRVADDACVTVVVAGGGYPGPSPTGLPVEGLAAAAEAGAVVFHAGTAAGPEGGVVTAGGRILAVTGLGPTLADARARAYAGVAAVRIEGARHRTDIAAAPTTALPGRGGRSPRGGPETLPAAARSARGGDDPRPGAR
jgi:phosphoribosylamine---glycine ligase